MQNDRFYLEHALKEAYLALASGTHPVGSVLVAPDGQIIGRGRNRIYSAGDATSHAEIDAIRDAGNLVLLPEHQRLCTLYTTAEPCMMCTGSILAATVQRVVWGSNGGTGSFRSLAENPQLQPMFTSITYGQIDAPDLLQECERLWQNWNNRQTNTPA